MREVDETIQSSINWRYPKELGPDGNPLSPTSCPMGCAGGWEIAGHLRRTKGPGVGWLEETKLETSTKIRWLGMEVGSESRGQQKRETAIN